MIEITLSLSLEEANFILEVLSAQTYSKVSALIPKIQKQAQAQLVEAAIPKDIAVEKSSDVGL